MSPPSINIDWMSILALSIGGSLGAITRHLISQYSLHIGLYSGTIVVNLLGSLALGFIAGMTWQQAGISPWIRLGLTTGFLGAFTTFSTFSLENADLVHKEEWMLLLLNLLLQTLGGLLCALLGFYLGQRWQG